MRAGLVVQFLLLLLFQVQLVEAASAQSDKRIGEVPEAPDSYRDPGFPNPQGTEQGEARSNSQDPSIQSFNGNRSPGLPDSLEASERPDFPNFRFKGTDRVVLYGTDRNGKRFEREVTRSEFETLQETYEKSQH